MLTSAPFDNWWHNAYGLDVKIISPPHTILAIGIFAIVTGALLLTLSEQNRATGDGARQRLAWLLAAVAGMFIMNYALFLTEYSERRSDAQRLVLRIDRRAVFTFGLAAMSRAIKLKWAATAAAAFYTILMLGLMWIIGALSGDAQARTDLSARHAHGDAVVSAADHRAGDLLRPRDAAARRTRPGRTACADPLGRLSRHVHGRAVAVRRRS